YPQKNGALAQAFAYQRELAGLEIAQPAMNQFTGAARSAARKPPLLDEQAAIAGGRGCLQHAGSVYAAADDDHIVFFHLYLQHTCSWQPVPLLRSWQKPRLGVFA